LAHLRSLEELQQNHEDWLASGSKKSDAKGYQNAIARCLPQTQIAGTHFHLVCVVY
jgi:hypothetical protein